MGSDDYRRYLQTLELFLDKDTTLFDAEILYANFKGLRDSGMRNNHFEGDPTFREQILNITVEILNTLFNNYSEKFLPSIGQALQFIHNLTVNNHENQLKVREKCKAYIKHWMQPEHEKHRNYISGILFNITLGHPEYLTDILQDAVLLLHILNSASKGTDFSILLTEKIQDFLADKPDVFMDNYFQTGTSKVEMLNILHECVQTKTVNSRLVAWVKERYKEKVSNLNLITGASPDDFSEIYYFLKILVVFSGNEETNTVLQQDVDLLNTTNLFLEKIHNEGRNSANEFTPTVNILTTRSSTENVKSNLIRLIGNLCWRNKVLQDRVRELNGIPLILDCCIRDGNNPFITESAIFATRNLCEGNFENQNFIKNMNKLTHDEMSERAQNWSSFYIPNIGHREAN